MAVARDPTASRGTRNKKCRQRRRRQARTDVNPALPPPHLTPKQGPRLPQKSKSTVTEQATAYAVPITEVIQILQEILAAVQEGRVKEVVPTILRALTRLLRTRCPTIKFQLNALAERVSAVLEDHAVDSWYKTIERAGEDWRGIHRICRQVSRKSEPIRPLLASDSTPRYRTADRAEIFADYLETHF
ncbi:unnamed protein product [Danaus chrysippus]|uniref:(African queen) hypothetical protein n=1 Tax=Danaus chrysippus TaxID=151541 RepID=A0A8J2QWU5_9NEOP|nr:unnamed protein product [Danaus chrysippus]